MANSPTLKARMKNPVLVVPEAMQALMALAQASQKGGVPSQTLGLVHLRASQINGCSSITAGAEVR